MIFKYIFGFGTDISVGGRLDLSLIGQISVCCKLWTLVVSLCLETLIRMVGQGVVRTKVRERKRLCFDRAFSMIWSPAQRALRVKGWKCKSGSCPPYMVRRDLFSLGTLLPQQVAKLAWRQARM
jgi:hypothetical protein